MRACWAVTLLVLVQPSPASCATCKGTSALPRVLALTHRHRHKSPCVRQPFAEISGSIAFSPLWFLSRKLCPIFVCQFKGSLQRRHRSYAGFEDPFHITASVQRFRSERWLKWELSRFRVALKRVRP